jgi:hypothetical protein
MCCGGKVMGQSQIAIAEQIKAMGGDTGYGEDGKAIVAVEFRGKRFGDEELQLLDGFGDLLYLWIIDTRITDASLPVIGRCTAITHLEIHKSSITDAALGNLEGLRELVSLALVDCKLTGVGLISLQGLDKLESIDVNGSPITNDGLAVLSQLSQVKELDLRRTHVDSSGMVYLSKLSDLTRLFLDGTDVGDDGLNHLLGTDVNIRGLTSKRISELGRFRAHLASRSFQRNWQAQSKHGITIAAAKEGARARFNVHGPSLRREDFAVAFDELSEDVEYVKFFSELSLKGSRIGEEGLARLPVCDAFELVELDVSETSTGDAGLLHISKLARLRRLNLSKTRITDAGLQHLRGHKNLQELDLSHTAVTSNGLHVLRQIPHLVSLRLDGTSIPPARQQQLFSELSARSCGSGDE